MSDGGVMGDGVCCVDSDGGSVVDSCDVSDDMVWVMVVEWL